MPSFPGAMVCSLAASLTLAAAASAAGPTFRLEFGPVIATNAPKNGLFAIRALACADLREVHVAATAESLVNGERRSVPLRLIALDTPGVYSIPSERNAGTWVASVTATCPTPKATAAALVSVQSGRFDRASSTFLDRAATPGEIDAALRTVVTASAR
jgi:hypothetical protein